MVDRDGRKRAGSSKPASANEPLHSLIAGHKTDLLEAWKRRVRGSLDPQSTDTREIENTLPAFVDELIEAFQSTFADNKPKPAGSSRVAAEHGRQRFHAGMNLPGVIREYGALRDSILDIVEASGRGLTLDEDRLLSRLINSAVADAAHEFARHRDEQIQRQDAEHFAFVAHEIRSPIGAIVLGIETLKRKGLLPSDSATERIERAITRLRRVVDDSILQVKLGSLGSSLALHGERIDLERLLGDVVDEWSANASARDVTLELTPATGLQVDADARLLYSTVSNLVGNAIKFTRPSGRVQIRAGQGEGRISIEVEDECGGLPPGKTEELFLPFRQMGRDRSGFGLGLAIAKQAVEAHQGSLQARNLPGRGCVFMVDLPAPQ